MQALDARMNRILVVDDEPLVAGALRRILGGYDLTLARGGPEGLRILESDGGFEIVFCDLMMPDVSGIDLYERVRARAPEVARRFVFLTGDAFSSRARDFLDAVPNLCIEKPFEAKAIRQVVQERLQAAAA